MSSRLHAASRFAAITLLGCTALAGCQDCNKGGATASDAGAGGAAPPTDSSASLTPIVLEAGTLNATPLPTASVAAMVNRDNLPPYAGPTGSVEGNITVIGDPAKETPADFSRCPDAENTFGRAFREGARDPVATNNARPLADAIVVVTGHNVAGHKASYVPEKNEAKEVRIEKCAPVERSATLTFGQRIEVKNLTNEFWTPVLEPGQNLVLIMATPHGDPAKLYPKKPGHFLLADRDRKYATVDVYVFLHSLHTSSALTGYYRIDGIPVGKQKVSAMHPQIDAAAEQEITISPGVVHKVDLVLKNVNREAGAPEAGLDAGYQPLR